MKTTLKMLMALVLAPALFLCSDNWDSSQCCQPNANVFLTCPCTTFDGYYRALWLQPTTSNLCYAVEAELLSPASPNWRIHEIKPQCNYASELGLGFIFHDRNAKLKVNWLHFTSQDKNSVELSNSDIVGPFFEIDPDATPYNKAKGHVKVTFDSACVNYGVLVSFGCHLHTYLYGGVAGIKLKQVVSSKFSNSDGSIVHKMKVPSRYWGVGPQLGMECSYNICSGFKVIGEAAASLLVGGLTNHTNYQSFSPALDGLEVTPPNRQFTHVPQRTTMVPAFEGRLGLGYSWTMCSCYDVSIDGGYKAGLYMNAVQTVNIGSEVNTPPVTPGTAGVYARTFRREVSNFALAGPYLSINVKF